LTTTPPAAEGGKGGVICEVAKLSVAIAIPSLVQSTIVMAFDDDTAVAHFAAPTAVPIAIVMPLDNDGFRFCGRDGWQSETQQREPRRENNQVAHLIPPLYSGLDSPV
jgi:hypothetical protein